MSFKPIVIDAGQLKQLPSGQALDVGAWTLPTAGGTEGYLLQADGSGNAAWTEPTFQRVLTANEDWYVATTGDDDTGDGSSGDPWATIHKAIVEAGKASPGAYMVDIHIAGGIYNYSEGAVFNHPNGRMFQFFGDYEDGTSSATTFSIDGTAVYDGTAQLQKFNAVFTLPVGFVASVGEYILVRETPSGGTYPELIKGVWEVTAWDSGNNRATVQIWNCNGTAMPSGTITFDFSIMRTVHVMASGKRGITVTGFLQGGYWDGIVMQGGRDGDGYGINLTTRGAITAGSRFCTSGFKYGIYASYGTFSDLYGSTFSASSAQGVRCQGSYLMLRFCVIAGTRLGGIMGLRGTSIRGDQTEIYGTGTPMVYCDNGSWIDATGVTLKHGLGWAFTATKHSIIDGSDSVIANVPNNRNPTTDGGNYGSYIIGVT